MKAFVAGATGGTGRHIVEELVRRDIPVRGLVRDLEKAKDMLPPQVEFVVGDVLAPDSYRDAIADCTVLLCATGARPSFDPTGPYQVDFLGTKNLIAAARDRRMERFVLVSSLCTSKFFHPLNLFWLVLYWKKQAEQALQESGLAYTIVRPGGLRDRDSSDNLVMEGADTLFDGSVSRQKVARTCVESLFQASAKNKIVEIVAREDAPDRDLPALFASV